MLGEAFQLTNFIRDVAEDLDRGRIYLPLEDLERFGVSEDDLRRARTTGQPSPAVRALLDFEVRRALELYEDARPGPGHGRHPSRPCLEAAFVLYRQILARGGRGRAQRVRRPAERAALAAAGHGGPGRGHRRRGGLAGPLTRTARAARTP